MVAPRVEPQSSSGVTELIRELYGRLFGDGPDEFPSECRFCFEPGAGDIALCKSRRVCDGKVPGTQV